MSDGMAARLDSAPVTAVVLTVSAGIAVMLQDPALAKLVVVGVALPLLLLLLQSLLNTESPLALLPRLLRL